MPGAFAPVNRVVPADFGGVARRGSSPYAAGLSHFPDNAPPGRGLGDAYSAVSAGVNLLPGGNYISTAFDVATDLFGGTSTVDQQRKARADYFGQLAMSGNVNAARILIGGTQNTSGNEIPYWQSWLQQLQATAAGQQTLAQAQQLGAWWPVGSSDTVTNYPIMRNFAASWAASNTVAGGIANVFGLNPSSAAATSRSVQPFLIAGAVAAGAYFLLRKR